MSALLDNAIDPQFRVRDVSRSFTMARVEEAPVSAMGKKGPKPKSTLYEWGFKTRHTPSDNAIGDNVDVEDSELINNESLKAMIQGRTQKGRVVVGVDDVAEELGEEYTSGGGMLAENVADGIVLARENFEVTLLKNGNSQAYTSKASPRKLRGLVYWIRSTNADDSDLPVRTPALTPAGNIITGKAAAANVSEENFIAVLQSIVTTQRKMKNVHVFATPAMRTQISSWMKFTPESAGNVAVRRFNNDAGDKEIAMTVERIRCDFGVFFLHTHFSLPTGVHALILDMDMIEIAPVRPPQMRALEYRGGAHRRMIEYIYGLRCQNPQAHGKITT